MSTEKTPEDDKAKLRRLLSLNVEEIGLGSQIKWRLAARKIRTIGQLVVKTEAELLKFRDIGATALREIKDKLAPLGLTLGLNIDPSLLDEEPATFNFDNLLLLHKSETPQFSVWVDPGQADVSDLEELFSAMSELHRAVGGKGLIFQNSDKKALAMEGA